MEPRTVAYLRVSTKAQAEDKKTGFKRQEIDINQYAERNDLHIDEVVKEAFTGEEAKRPEFDRLMDALPKGSTIIVQSMDRFTRSNFTGLPLLLNVIGNGLDMIDVSTNECVTTALNGTPWQKLIVQMKIVISEFMRDDLAYKLKRGREIKSQELGRYVGGPKELYPPEFRKELQDMRESGMTYQAIADNLNSQKGQYKKTAGGLKWTPPLVSAAMRGGTHDGSNGQTARRRRRTPKK